MPKALKQLLRRARFYYIHRAPRAAIEAYQVESLRYLVSHAMRHVPFYKEFYRRAHVSLDTLRSLTNTEALPITSKDMYRTTPTAQLVRGDLRAMTAWKKTSGSTGHPLTILTSTKMNQTFYSDFACFRFWVEDRLITPLSFRNARVAHINVRARERDTHEFITITDFQNDMDAAIRRIAAHEPDIIASYTSILLDMARSVTREPSLLPKKPRYCSCFGEMITPAVRAEIENGLGCELFDRYGGTEMGAAASECRMHDGLHEHSESAIIEIVDAEGRCVPDGIFGRILLTDLVNYNMPFIRYEIGDSGRIMRERCACGLETPRLYLEGRYSAHLSFGKRRVHHLEFDGALDGLMNVILQYRVAKESETSLVVQIIPGPLYADATPELIRARISDLVPGVAVRVDIVETIPRTARGKSQIVADLTA